MNCMRCGKKAEGNDVFCPECLAEMARYPVAPGTPVQTPPRPEVPEAKKAPRKKKEIPLEDQLASARRLIHRLMMAALTLLLALCVAIGLLLHKEPDTTQETQIPKTRNYTTTLPTED